MVLGRILVISSLLTFVYSFKAYSQHTIEDYNKELLVWGISWKGGEGTISHYYPSFYTGFAPRSQFPERIHIRTSRGNQTRVSVILDHQTISDYLYDLVARGDFYKQVTSPHQGRQAALDVNPQKASLSPQLAHFIKVIESDEYLIKSHLQNNEGASLVTETFYQKSLEVLSELNPERVYMIDLDLNQSFRQWRDGLRQMGYTKPEQIAFTAGSSEAVLALNTLVWGRVNITAKPSNEIITKLNHTAKLAISGSAGWVAEAFDLFKTVTGSKYNFKTLDSKGNWIPALSCGESSCRLTYPEFTTIYPTGSAKSYTHDKHGNKITNFATPGLWPFIDRSYHEVDHIRREPYYGFAPKLDFEGIGNGFHNPAVRFYGSNFSKDVKDLLNAPQDHSHLWAVKRGGVSSGCLRLALGHVWEMRHIMPVENEKMKEVFQFGHNSMDFDLYDIDGDGLKEVMGVEYLISYNTKGTSGLDKRDGEDLNIGMNDKADFYENLYGSRSVFSTRAGQFIFHNPSVSFPSYLDLRKKRVKTTFELRGDFPLYEQTYEQDKAQFYKPITKRGLESKSGSGLGKRLVRLMGRVRGCAPFSNKKTCGQTSFENEKKQILSEIY